LLELSWDTIPDKFSAEDRPGIWAFLSMYFYFYCGARLPYIPKPEEPPVVKQIEKPVEDNRPGT
jgi:hypothetical protein